jgi:hypothetical protein
MDSLQRLRDKIHRNTLCTRSIEAIVMSKRFERLWSESDQTQRTIVEKLIEEDKRLTIIDWMKNHPSLALGERPLSYLRSQGKRLRIKNYSRLSKPELIREISQKEQDDEKKQGGNGSIN